MNGVQKGIKYRTHMFRFEFEFSLRGGDTSLYFLIEQTRHAVCDDRVFYYFLPICNIESHSANEQRAMESYPNPMGFRKDRSGLLSY